MRTRKSYINPNIRVIVQARMNSARFPGKVLAPFNGLPIIAHVIERLSKTIALERIVLATSNEISDDPLAVFVRQIGVNVFRGSLDNVFERFRGCLREYPCDWFFRICADSPLIDGALLERMLPHYRSRDLDLVTNVQVRTFPRGRSVEFVRAETFENIDPVILSEEEREHVTTVYYRNPKIFKILNIESSDPTLAGLNYCVDKVEDLLRLEAGEASKGSCVDSRVDTAKGVFDK